MGSDTNVGALVRQATAAAVALLAMTGAFNEDELKCEEAIAHIEDCCPRAQLRNLCGEADGYCEGATLLSREESDCIMGLRCDEHAQEVCERLEALSEEVSHPGQEGNAGAGGAGSTRTEGSRKKVCP